jgi:hypothetical protein
VFDRKSKDGFNPQSWPRKSTEDAAKQEWSIPLLDRFTDPAAELGKPKLISIHRAIAELTPFFGEPRV